MLPEILILDLIPQVNEHRPFHTRGFGSSLSLTVVGSTEWQQKIFKIKNILPVGIKKSRESIDSQHALCVQTNI